MSELQGRLKLGRVTAPDFSDNPTRWAQWYITHGAAVYKEFRRLCLEMLSARPDLKLSADQVLHVVRWNSRLRAQGDVVAVNNNASALFARLFADEHPEHADAFERRRSVWDDLPPAEWQLIWSAHMRARRRP